MRNTFLCLVLLSSYIILKGQQSQEAATSEHYISLNVGTIGVAIGAGINYERQIGQGNWHLKGGATFYAHGVGEGSSGSAVQIQGVFHLQAVEIGFGVAYVGFNGSDFATIFFPSLFIAYRKEFDRGFFRAGVGLFELVHVGYGYRI